MNPNGFSEPNSELLGRCNLSSSSSSIGGGGGGGGGSGGEDEQEDVAKCLILLSQGLPASQPSSSMVKFIEDPQGQNGNFKRYIYIYKEFKIKKIIMNMYLNCRRGQGNRVLRIRVQNLQPNLPIISSPRRPSV